MYREGLTVFPQFMLSFLGVMLVVFIFSPTSKECTEQGRIHVIIFLILLAGVTIAARHFILKALKEETNSQTTNSSDSKEE